MGFDVHL